MHHVALDDERVRKVIDAAVGGDARVFVHCGQLTVGVRKALGLPSAFDLRLGDPLEVARLANAYPSVPFIVPHFGAGLLREALTAADTCPNIYLDTSSSNRWIRYMPGLTLDEVFRSALSVVGAGRILFGTDSSYFPRGWQKNVYDDQKAALDRIGVGTADQDLIFGGTFDRLFS
jgi:predicted TIM-barrel fold metal-dependent hydrolase